MSIYLVDYENVSLLGLEGIEKLKEEEKVFIFYGNSAGSISFEMHAKIAQTKAEVKYLKTERSGKNYLDFQLATLSGYLVATTKETDFIIISKDTGFESVIDFWNQQSVADHRCQFSRQERIDGLVSKKAEEKPKPAPPVKATVQPKPTPQVKTTVQPKPTPQPKIVSPAKVEEKEQPAVQGEEKPKSSYKRQTRMPRQPRMSRPPKSTRPSGSLSQLEQMKEQEPVRAEEVMPQEVTAVQADMEVKQDAGPKQLRPLRKQREILPKLEERYKKEIRELVREECNSPKDYSMIYKIIMRTNSTEMFYSQMLAAFKKDRGTRLYDIVLPVYQRVLREKKNIEQ